MERVKLLSKHLTAVPGTEMCKASRVLSSETSSCPFKNTLGAAESRPSSLNVQASSVSAAIEEFQNAEEIPIVAADARTSTDPVNWLLEQAKIHPDIFIVDRGRGHKYAVVRDEDMMEDILTFDDDFGNPQTSNMSVNKFIFEIPEDQLDRHEQNIIAGLRRLLLNECENISNKVAQTAKEYLLDVLGESGQVDMRDFGMATFWSMNRALFGEKINNQDCSFLFEAFENIDKYFGKALKGRKVPIVQEGVKKCVSLFSGILNDARDGKANLGPILNFYEEGTQREDILLSAKFATAALWGGSGNSVPSTVWSFGYLLSDAKLRQRAYQEADKIHSTEPNASGHYDYDKLKFFTAVFQETLRLKTYSIAWRQSKRNTVLRNISGKAYKVPEGSMLGLHFALRHMDPSIHADPYAFRPDRFLDPSIRNSSSSTMNGHKYAWVPFSAGRHKCSGYALAMLEMPVIMAIAFNLYDMEILDPLPGNDYKQAFGVFGLDSKPAQVRYKKRTQIH